MGNVNATFTKHKTKTINPCLFNIAPEIQTKKYFPPQNTYTVPWTSYRIRTVHGRKKLKIEATECPVEFPAEEMKILVEFC